MLGCTLRYGHPIDAVVSARHRQFVQELVPIDRGGRLDHGAMFEFLILGSKRRKEEPELRLYRRFCRKMVKRGVQILPGEGPLDFARHAKVNSPEIGYLIDDITQLFIRLRYSRSASVEDIEQLKAHKKISL
jgi:hypothetical protein